MSPDKDFFYAILAFLSAFLGISVFSFFSYCVFYNMPF